MTIYSHAAESWGVLLAMFGGRETQETNTAAANHNEPEKKHPKVFGKMKPLFSIYPLLSQPPQKIKA